MGQTHSAFDFWIFRDLSAEEKAALIETLEKMKFSRIVVAANHLMNWKKFAEDPELKRFLDSNQLFLSFLPQTDELGPFLKPQEILSELQGISASYPILVSHFHRGNESSFYQTLRKEDYLLELQTKKKGLWKFLRVLDQSGFHLLLLAIESLLAFFLEGGSQRLVKFTRHVTDFASHSYRTTRNALKKVIWYWGLHKVWIWIRFHVANFFKYKVFGFIKYIWGKYLYGTFLSPLVFKTWGFFRYRLWGLIGYRVWNFLQFQVWGFLKYRVWGFFRYRIGGLIKYRIWNFIRYKIGGFFQYKVWGFLKGPAWILFRYKVWGFLRGPAWVVVRYRIPELILLILYPFRKIYWFSSYQFKKRILFRIKRNET